MRGPPVQAHLVDIDHSHLSVDLGIPEAAGSADTQLVPSAEEPPDPGSHMPADSVIGLTCMAEAEVPSPSQQESVNSTLSDWLSGEASLAVIQA